MNAVLLERSSDAALELAATGVWSALAILLLTFKRKLMLINCVELCLFSLPICSCIYGNRWRSGRC